jgi:DNA-directed RNA polymerase specialized sigma24 family protein
MVGAPPDTTRADRGGAAAPVDRGGVLRRLLRSAGEPKSVNDTADRFRTADSAQTATFTSDADSQAWTPPTWEEIVSTHSARVYRLAYRLTGNQHDAEDLTQEVFVRVFRSLSTYTPGTFEGWLHRITTNLFLDMVRRKQRIRFDALGRRRGRAPAQPRALPAAGLQRHALRRGRPAGPRHPRPGVPRRGRPVRHRRDFRTRRSPRPWASSSARSAAASTAAAPSCARRSPTARPRPVPSAAVSRSPECPLWEEGARAREWITA